MKLIAVWIGLHKDFSKCDKYNSVFRGCLQHESGVIQTKQKKQYLQCFSFR